jgi:hypothetical protein
VREEPLGAPTSSSVVLPSDTSDISQLITLPITGDLIDDAFGHYQHLLGVTFSKVMTHQAPIVFSRMT